jgi:general secretion pathway protein L
LCSARRGLSVAAPFAHCGRHRTELTSVLACARSWRDALPIAAELTASTERAVTLAAAFWRWWRSELLAMVPEQLRTLSPQRGRVVLLLSDGSAPATVFTEIAGAANALAQLADPNAPEAGAAVQAALRQPGIADQLARGELGLCLRLPARWGLCRTIDLPLAAETNLAEVIGFELDRYTPFRAEQACFCHRIIARDPAAQRLSVEITVVPKPVLDGALRMAGDLGWAPERVDVVDANQDLGHSDNLLSAVAPAARRGRTRATIGLAIIAAALTIAAVAIPFVAAERRASAMTEELAEVEKQAQTAIALQKEIAALSDGQDFLVAHKRQARTASSLLADVTRLLPDNTWLTELRINGQDIELIGITASASALIGILEQSGLFRDTTFRSPVVPDPSSGRERFGIGAHIVPEHRS